MIKTCQICGDIKPLAEFSKNRSKKDRRRMQDAVAFANRRAKEYGLHDKLCLSDWEEVLETHGHQCLVCGTDSDITLDHIFNYAQRSRD